MGYGGRGKNLVEGEMVGDNVGIEGMWVRFWLIFEKGRDGFMKCMIKGGERGIDSYV